MKVIFSRKGFDSEAGGSPSPIIGRLPVSLPTPLPNKKDSGAKYSDITVGTINLGQLVQDLTGGKVRADDRCYPNPILDKGGVLGLSEESQRRLAAHKIGKGDLFLFYGLFRAAELYRGSYRYVKDSAPHYRIFGWLEVGDARRLRSRRKKSRFDRSEDDGGTMIYSPTEELALAPDESLPGSGKFRSDHPSGILSVGEGNIPGLWGMPDWLTPRYAPIRDRVPSEVASSEKGKPAEAGDGKPHEFVGYPNPERSEEMKDWLAELFNGRYVW